MHDLSYLNQYASAPSARNFTPGEKITRRFRPCWNRSKLPVNLAKSEYVISGFALLIFYCNLGL